MNPCFVGRSSDQFVDAVLLWHAALYRIGEGLVSNAPVLGDRQLFTQPHLEAFKFGRRHLTDYDAGRSVWDLYDCQNSSKLV